MFSALNIGWVAVLVIMLISLALVISFASLIYVIVKRIQDKKAEDFEERDN